MYLRCSGAGRSVIPQTDLRSLNQERHVPDPSQTAIAVTAKILFLNFFMLLFKPTVEIDGQALQGAWSTTTFPTTPGQHRVTVFWKYLGLLPINKASATFAVREGVTTELTYKPRWFIFLPGKMTVSQAVPAAV